MWACFYYHIIMHNIQHYCCDTSEHNDETVFLYLHERMQFLKKLTVVNEKSSLILIALLKLNILMYFVNLI